MMIHAAPDLFITSVRSVLPIAIAFFAGGSLLIEELVAAEPRCIDELDDHVIPPKDLFYSWLLVFFNAYIGIFIANRAIKHRFSRFFAWALLGNGLRSGIYLILLLLIVEWLIFNVRGFVLMTFFGYFTFLAVEIYGLQKCTAYTGMNLEYNDKDE